MYKIRDEEQFKINKENRPFLNREENVNIDWWLLPANGLLGMISEETKEQQKREPENYSSFLGNIECGLSQEEMKFRTLIQ